MAYPSDPVQAPIPGPTPTGTTKKRGRIVSLASYLASPKVQAQVHKLVTAALALYVALHRAGI